MHKITKKILVDLIVSPFVGIPSLLGCMFIWLGVILGSGLTIFTGTTGLMFGLGMFFTKIIFGVDKLAEKAYNDIQVEQEEEKQEYYDTLRSNLCKDRDSRTQDYFDQLMAIKVGLNILPNDIAYAAVKDKSLEIVNASIKGLDKSYELYLTAKKLKGKPKKEIERKREKVINEVAASIETLNKVILHHQGNEVLTETPQLREELEESLEVARRVEERMANFTKKEVPEHLL